MVSSYKQWSLHAFYAAVRPTEKELVMKVSRTWALFGATLAVAVVCLVPRAADAQPNETTTIVVKEKAIVSDTYVPDQAPSTVDGAAPAVPPFRGNREVYPAGTAVTGETAVGLDVVNYASSVAKRTDNELVLNTTISKLEDDDTLSRLANRVYMENGGPNYQNVTIFWHVGQNPEPRAPWARTDITRDNAIYKVVRIQQ